MNKTKDLNRKCEIAIINKLTVIKFNLNNNRFNSTVNRTNHQTNYCHSLSHRFPLPYLAFIQFRL